MPVPTLILRALPRKHGDGEEVRDAVRADHATEITNGGTPAIKAGVPPCASMPDP